jgi:hypothetical protein
MSLFNSQTIFSILITLLIGAALYYYIKYKYRILELTQREQAKVLQSVIMSMNNNNHNLVSMIQGKSNEELVSESIAHDMNRFSEVNKTNELIDVSDDDDSESESESGSDSGSESGSESDSGSESGSDDESEGGNNNNDSTTKKILFTGNHESHLVEHLEGPDVKIIELSHPLYSKNENDNEIYNKNAINDDEDQDDDESSSDNDSEGDSESVTSDMDGPHEPSEGHDIHDIKGNTITIEMNNQNDLETVNISEIVSVDNSLDNLLVKAVFKNKENKDNKDSETHTDYNSMNVQSLRQLLKNKLASDGSNMSESSINKLTKKDLIKHLS